MKIIREHSLFVALLLAALVLSFFIAENYGETADDNLLQIYAEHSVDVYSTILGEGIFIAPENSLVASWGSVQIVESVARPDLRLELVNERNFDPQSAYDYVVVPIGGARGRYFFAGFPETVVVSRLG